MKEYMVEIIQEKFEGYFELEEYGAIKYLLIPKSSSVNTTIYAIAIDMLNNINLLGFYPNKFLQTKNKVLGFQKRIINAFSNQSKYCISKFKHWLIYGDKNYFYEFKTYLTVADFFKKHELDDMRLVAVNIGNLKMNEDDFAGNLDKLDHSESSYIKRLKKIGCLIEKSSGEELDKFHYYLEFEIFKEFLPNFCIELKNAYEQKGNLSLFKLITDSKTRLFPMDINGKVFKSEYQYVFNEHIALEAQKEGTYHIKSFIYNENYDAFALLQFNFSEIGLTYREDINIPDIETQNYKLKPNEGWQYVNGNIKGIAYLKEEGIANMENIYHQFFHEMMIKLKNNS